MIGEGVWCKGEYIIAGGPPFMVIKGGVPTIHDEVVCEVIANYPSLESAVMSVELNYEESEWAYITRAVLRRAVEILGGSDAGAKGNR